VPEVYPGVSRGGLLVLEYLAGVRVTDLAALRAAGHDPAAVAERVAGIYCDMIFEHGFFQGDPHPGNLLVLADGAIGLLDFGLCKELPPGFAERVAAMFLAALGGDGAGALREASELGFELGRADPAGVRPLVAALLGEPGAGAGALASLGETPLRRIPGDFALIARTLILLNGLSHVLAPGERRIQRELLRAMAPRVAALRAGA
jgi:ubiquinone biosynthesis protein